MKPSQPPQAPRPSSAVFWPNVRETLWDWVQFGMWAWLVLTVLATPFIGEDAGWWIITPWLLLLGVFAFAAVCTLLAILANLFR